jgi:hypothetical protein
MTEEIKNPPKGAETENDKLPTAERNGEPNPPAERETKGLPFIPSKFDDLGLTATQFRVACHISRVGYCWQAVPTIRDRA